MKKVFKSISIILCLLFVFNIGVLAAPPCDDADNMADALHDFGLFNGTGVASDGSPIYSLEKASTRQEAVVMLIRLLGKETEAKQCTAQHPFTDVDAWADRYVAYAYSKNIAKGISATQFGANQSVNAQQYLTFLLRALGYNDSIGDFSYENVFAFSDSIGLTNGIYALGNTFLRRDMAWLSSGALLQKNKSGTPLIKQLKKDGVISSEQYNNGLSTMMYAELMRDFRYFTLWGDGDEVLEIDVYGLYTEPGQGEYAGYSRLRGYAYDDKYPIYFQGQLGSYNYVTDHNDNLNDICTWTYNGVTYKNTRGDCYNFFSDTTYFQSYYSSFSNEVLSINWFKETFGKIYDDWFAYRAFESGNSGDLVERYLEMQNGTYYHMPRGVFSAEDYYGLFNFEEAWTEQELSADWIGTYELSELAGNRDLTFGIIAASLPDYSAGIGDLVYGFYLQGFFVEYLLCIYDMPKSFADMENGEATYSGIRFKKENGNWYFNPDDLIKAGLLNADGTLNETILEQDDYYSYGDDDYSSNDDKDSNNNFGYDSSKVNEEFKNEWISSSELKDIYNFSSYWAGEEIWIYRTALFGSDEEDIKYTLTGSPSSKFEKNKTYKCKYKKYTIRVQYDGGFDGGLLFNYEDLCNAGIIEKL